MKANLSALDAITDKVLAYRPPRKRRRPKPKVAARKGPLSQNRKQK